MLAHPNRAAELRERAKHLHGDGLHDSGSLMQLAAIDIEELHREVNKLREAIHEHPSKWSFDTLLWAGRRLLAEHYPADIFTGASGDPGPAYVVALRAALARCERTT